MKTPKHPAGPAFGKAADALENWRQQQIAALTETQRQLFDQARRKSEERQKANAKELTDRRETDVRQRMRKKLLETPQPALKPRGSRVPMTAVLAGRLVDAHFRGGRPPDHGIHAAAVSQAERAARIDIDREHRIAREVAARTERRGLDGQLRKFEQARNTRGQQRQAFARATARGKASADFAKSARPQVVKGAAIARAVEKVNKSKEQQRARDERGHSRNAPNKPGHTR